ncbi:hypothetical protein [Tropicimonas sp. IMCC34043]|uniref:hypothetical protein n=1 Tax=Tropicimonas sp. IMCC34043 TaxID=2248760 RepID=UPI000E27A0C5|nr:hypothetical protein [Tropicimonas sp. IMCC34043]
MNEFADLEARLAMAMTRIGRAMDGLVAAPAATALDEAQAEAASARAEAEAERARGAASDAELARLQETLEAQARTESDLRQRIETLDATKVRLQERLVGLEAELEAVLDARNADRAELDELIAALEPLVKEGIDA